MNAAKNAPLGPENMVFSQYPLLRNISRHLPMADLKALACASRSCLAAAKVTINDPERRRGPQTLCWSAEGPLTATEYQEQLMEAVRNHVMKTRIDPAVVISFLGSDVENWLYGDVDLESSFLVDHARIDRLLPKACHSVSMMTEGIVTMKANSLELVEVENTGGTFQPVASMMFFPKSDSFQVVPFKVNECLTSLQERMAEYRLLNDELSFQKHLFDSVFEGKLADPTKIKCVIVLTSSNEMPHMNFILREIGLQTKRQVAIGGAVGTLARASLDEADMVELATQARMENEVEEFRTSTGLVFAGDGIEAASILLGRDVKNEKKVELVLSELKKANLNEENSCAFMFACCGRGKGLYRTKNVESKVFRRLFPNTPLIGLFGGGEVGMTFLPNEEEEKDTFSDPNASKRKKKNCDTLLTSDEILHSYTTVFVLLSFKKL